MMKNCWGGLNDNADAEIEENAADAVVQAVLARIEALPDLETMLEDAPGEEEEGYEAWEARFWKRFRRCRT